MIKERFAGGFFNDNNGGVDDDKSIINAKRWNVDMKDKQSLIKVGYSVEVSNIDEKKVLWEVIEDHVVGEGKENDEIVL